MRIRIVGVLGFIAALFLSHSCIEDTLKLPARVSFGFNIQNDTALHFIRFTGVELRVKEFEFEGYRQAGEDYFFDHYFTTPLEVRYNTPVFPDELTFDLPQGVYTRMKVKIKVDDLEDGTNDREPGLGREDSIDYVMPETPSFVLRGFYRYMHGQEIPFLMVIDNEQFVGDVISNGSNSDIVISRDRQYQGTLTFRAGYAFKALSRHSLENADIALASNMETMVISKDHNEDIYEILLYRLQESFTVILE